jgi:CBS domain containing-hemolysin-like protein
VLIFVGLLLVLVLTGATGYFVAQEFGFVAVDRGRLRQAAERGDRRAARALKVTGRLSFMLSGAQLGITVTALLVGYVAEPFLGAGLADLLGVTRVPAALSTGIAVVLALAISTVVQMVLGELAPKNLALARAEGVARGLAGSTLGYLTAAGPVIGIFDAAANRLLRRVGIEPAEELAGGATAEDLTHIVATAEAEGHLDRQLSTLLDRGLDFRHRSAAEAMTPRVDVVCVGGREPCTRVVELLDSGHSRFPMLGEGGVDDVAGVVAITDLLAVPAADRSITPVSAVASEALFVPAATALRAVLDQLREEHRQLACVVDEYGGFAGVVSLEDIAEELVGPIRDEDDLPEPAPQREPDGSWLVPARWRLDEIADATGLRLPRPAGTATLSGLLLSTLGRVATEGDVVALDDLRAEVVTVRRRVPDSVRLSTRDAAGDTGDDESTRDEPA